MIIIDENLPDSQRQLLQGWRVSFKQVAFEIGREGLKDDEIIPSGFPQRAYSLEISCRRKDTIYLELKATHTC
ncbi:MAG: hypothetical protein GY797_38145 [Deltaproteobacteria bacterium]|nr:hypothetical protein [Deltaproteobacteria bacterium]